MIQSRCAARTLLSCIASVLLPGALSVPLNGQERVPGQAPEVLGAPTVLHGGGDRDAEPARFTLWLCRHGTDGDRALRDEGPYLADLQRRHGDGKVRIAVVLAPEAARREAQRRPAYVVAAADPAALVARAEEPVTAGLLCDGRGEVLASWPWVDGLEDVLAAAALDQLDGAALAELAELLAGLLPAVIDGGDYETQVARCVERAPRCGRVRALAVLNQWWSKGDYEAAWTACEQGLAALADHGLPLVEFADLVLRGDAVDRRPPRQLAMALAPAAAAAGEGAFTQLTYLHALLRAGQDRQAGRLLARLPKLCAGQPYRQLAFASILMQAAQPAVHRDAAEQALQAAAGADARWLAALRYTIAARCAAGERDLEDQLAEYLRSEGARNFGLNNDAWYLMVQPESMGRFSPFALAIAETMQRREGKDLSPGNMDTVALAKFVGGKLQEAVELQTTATRLSGDSPTYTARRERFAAAVALLQRQQGGK